MRKLRWDGLGRYILTLTIVFAEHQDSRFKDAYETQSQPSAPPRRNLCAPQQYNLVQECGVREVPSKAQQSSCQLHGYGTFGGHCTAADTTQPVEAVPRRCTGVPMQFPCAPCAGAPLSLASRPWHKRKPARAVVQALERVLVPTRGLSADHRASEGHEGGRAARASSSYKKRPSRVASMRVMPGTGGALFSPAQTARPAAGTPHGR